MSYCRANGVDSDVYVYASGEECLWLICFECRLIRGGLGEFNTVVRQTMLDHLAEHTAAGHKVPARAIACLTKEMEDYGDLDTPVGDRPSGY